MCKIHDTIPIESHNIISIEVFNFNFEIQKVNIVCSVDLELHSLQEMFDLRCLECSSHNQNSKTNPT